jgi:hypothetical protein
MMFRHSHNDLVVLAGKEGQRRAEGSGRDGENTPLLARSNSGRQSYTDPHSAVVAMGEGTKFLTASLDRWKTFADAWNSVVANLRETDIISNEERDILKFHDFGGMSGLNKPMYLPVFQTVGCVERVVQLVEEKGQAYNQEEGEAQRKELEKSLWDALGRDLTMYEAAVETIDLGSFLVLKLLRGEWGKRVRERPVPGGLDDLTPPTPMCAVPTP